MTRAMWKGTLQLGEAAVPVKLYAAAQARGVHFHLLHEPDHVRVRQHMVDPATDHPVPSEDIRRGHEVEPGVFVLVTPDELRSAAPEASRAIELSTFVDAAALEPYWYARPYYLGPDGAVERYRALCAALERSERIGIAQWVMRRKRYVGALRAVGEQLVLITLRAREQVRDLSRLEAPAGRAFDKSELALAEQLIHALAGHFDPQQFHDEYRTRVLELIEAKRRGKRMPIKRVPRKVQPASIADALQASLKAVHKERRSA
jgi:DNA end-binding protein Ku